MGEDDLTQLVGASDVDAVEAEIEDRLADRGWQDVSATVVDSETGEIQLSLCPEDGKYRERQQEDGS